MNRIWKMFAVAVVAILLGIAPAGTAEAATGGQVMGYDSVSYAGPLVTMVIPRNCGNSPYRFPLSSSVGGRLSAIRLITNNARAFEGCNLLWVRNRAGGIYQKCIWSGAPGYAFGPDYNNKAVMVFVSHSASCARNFDGTRNA